MSREMRPVPEFEISDAVWGIVEPLPEVRAKPVHLWGRHWQRVPDREVLNSLLYLLCSGGQWKSFNSSDPALCVKGSTAHDRFQERQELMEAGFFARFWEASLLDYEASLLDYEASLFDHNKMQRDT